MTEIINEIINIDDVSFYYQNIDYEIEEREQLAKAKKNKKEKIKKGRIKSVTEAGEVASVLPPAADAPLASNTAKAVEAMLAVSAPTPASAAGMPPLTAGAASSTLAPPPKYALKNVSFKIYEGEFTAIVGCNGSGKSTLAKHINGLLIPDEGGVTVLGLNTKDKKVLFEIRKNTGMVFQNPDNQMVASIVEDDVAFGPENIGVPQKEIVERVEWALSCVDMLEFRSRTTERLSGGQKQRIAIAGVLAIKPKILVLDESTAMLDPRGRREVLDIVKRLNREQGITVILITHFMDEALLADRIFVMYDGKTVLSGTPSEVFSESDALKQIGLNVPSALSIAQKLRRGGMPISGDALTIGELAKGICQLL
jgi:energy-coupling factor transport system ATP-binding protein